MDPIMLNIGSLGLGLAAWGLGIAGIVLAAGRRGIWPVLPFASMACCALAICLQLYYQSHLVEINDLSAILDTAEGVAGISMFLLVSSLGVNVVAFVVWAARKRAG